MNQDVIIEILSHLPASVVGKFRLLNKECNKRTYDSFFLKLSLQRTNSVSCYFIEYQERHSVRSAFVEVCGNRPCGTKVSLDFLPPGRVMIKACDTSHGILLCVNPCPLGRRGRESEYIVCKPTTKQYVHIPRPKNVHIPRPKNPYFTVALGIMVIGTKHFRYKMVRLSRVANSWENKKYNFDVALVCEVFDSDSFSWKRLNNVELPDEEDFFISTRNSNPVAWYGMLHWLTNRNNVVRFCFKTETWSFFPVPDNLASDDQSLKLTKYEGKLGVISSRSKEGVNYEEIWVLKSSNGNSWVQIKEIKTIGLEAVGFFSSDVVTLASNVGRFCSYNMNNGKSQNLKLRGRKFSPSHYSSIIYFPLYSDYERVELKGRSYAGQAQTLRVAGAKFVLGS